jgi:hypothetical protein
VTKGGATAASTAPLQGRLCCGPLLHALLLPVAGVEGAPEIAGFAPLAKTPNAEGVRSFQGYVKKNVLLQLGDIVSREIIGGWTLRWCR